MDAVVATRLSYIVEEYQVLPSTYMGGRRMRSAEYALDAVTAKIY